MANESHAHPPHHRVRAPMTEKPSGTEENGCAMTMSRPPAASRTTSRFACSRSSSRRTWAALSPVPAASSSAPGARPVRAKLA